MALWLNRAGRNGEHETRFLEDGVIYCNWGGLNWDLSEAGTWEKMKERMAFTYPSDTPGQISNQSGQVWSFSHRMEKGDLVALPSKISPTIHIGVITGEYTFNPDAEDRYKHYRKVNWLKNWLRTSFPKDLLYSFGSLLTICQIANNDAEKRVKDMLSGATQVPPTPPDSTSPISLPPVIDDIDIESEALQAISDRIIQLYKGHDLANMIIASILEAKGFTVHVSPEGPDKGVDILAAQGSLGFDRPFVCVQVKSGTDPIDRPTHDQLLGAMSNHKAEYGLLVSWGGFKKTITNDVASHFFSVRLWSRKEIVEEFLRHYEDMPDEVKENIPLKRIWVIDQVQLQR